MKTMAAGKFKAQCLSMIDEVYEFRQEVIITKHGKPMAKLVSLQNQRYDIFGFMRGRGRIVGDVMAPVDAGEWNSEK